MWSQRHPSLRLSRAAPPVHGAGAASCSVSGNVKYVTMEKIRVVVLGYLYILLFNLYYNSP